MPDSAPLLEIGAPAPDFEGLDQHNRTVRLADYRGQKVVLYAYPKDDTPGCTKQACNLRDNHSALLQAGIAVLGISTDSVASHEKFAGKYDLPFPLIADPDHEILDRYGAYGRKSMYGRTYFGTKRTTFLIDEGGRLVHVFKKPKVKEHAEEILAFWSD